MPIYCLNGTQSARKRSKNIMHELVSANNYYMNNSQHLSMASYHILVSKSKSLSSTSLMMVINRFKNSVKNMNESVLIPTRLSDLVSPDEERCPGEQAESLTDNGDRSEHWCRALSPVELSLSPTSPQCSTPRMESGPTMATSIKLHNLYEQYKLLNLIDKILSSDATLTLSSSQRQRSKSAAIVLNGFENDDNNNSKQTAGQEESVKFNSPSADSDAHSKRLLIRTVGQSRVNSQPTAELATKAEMANGNGQPEDTCSSGDLVTSCSLLKIKDKLEYHLVSLKNILSLMSNSADYITQKYLEDIQCEDRFDKQAKSCDQHDSIRHYYTSNNNANSHL